MELKIQKQTWTFSITITLWLLVEVSPNYQNYPINTLTYRSYRPKVFHEKGVLKNVVKPTGKHLCPILFFNKVAGLLLLRTVILNNNSASTKSKRKTVLFWKDIITYSIFSELNIQWDHIRDEFVRVWSTRGSRPEVFSKKVILEIFAKFPGKHLCDGLFFNKVAVFSL